MMHSPIYIRLDSQCFVVSPSLLRWIAVLLTRTKDPRQTSFQSVLSCVGTRDRKNNFLGWLIYLNTMKSRTARLQVTTLCSGIVMCAVLVSTCLLQGCVSHLYQGLKLLILKNNTFLLYRVKLRETVCEKQKVANSIMWENIKLCSILMASIIVEQWVRLPLSARKNDVVIMYCFVLSFHNSCVC